MTLKWLKIRKICYDSVEIPDINQLKTIFHLYVFITITRLKKSLKASDYFLYYRKKF